MQAVIKTGPVVANITVENGKVYTQYTRVYARDGLYCPVAEPAITAA